MCKKNIVVSKRFHWIHRIESQGNGERDRPGRRGVRLATRFLRLIGFPRFFEKVFDERSRSSGSEAGMCLAGRPRSPGITVAHTEPLK
jgi:hypothetical protein